MRSIVVVVSATSRDLDGAVDQLVLPVAPGEGVADHAGCRDDGEKQGGQRQQDPERDLRCETREAIIHRSGRRCAQRRRPAAETVAAIDRSGARYADASPPA
jgi:hypothetical protein